MTSDINPEPNAKKQPSKLKKLFLFFIAAPLTVIVGLALIVGIIGGIKGVQSANEQPAKQTQPKTVTSQATIGSTINDGSFSFIVNSVHCGEKHINTTGVVAYYSDAQGQYCRLNITATNTSDGASSLDVSKQIVFNTQGQRYYYASNATANAANYYIGSPFSDDINPGNSITGDIVFDMPVGVNPVTAELHGKSNGSGVKVNLQ